MTQKPFNVLFVCTTNSARSILAEGLTTQLGQGRFKAFSAGTHPVGTVNPLALSTLQQLRIAADGLRSKSWREFTGPGAPELDFVFTLCDSAAGEACPAWSGQAMMAHWGVPDPEAVDGTDEEKAKAFMTTALLLKLRIELMLSLQRQDGDRNGLQGYLERIGIEDHAGPPTS
jgi:arsenate reductase (thioredoxin)